jgi:glycosyltransferase involved in cell wall biosynthesis
MDGSEAPAVSTPAPTHVVLIPSYNPGPKVFETVRAARAHWDRVWLIVDGSTDGTPAALQEMAAADPGLMVLVDTVNRGKGAAVLRGLTAAAAAGYTHALTMDSDGQHPAALIPSFMAASAASPRAMILGVPVFDDSAPRIRVQGRKLSNWWTRTSTLGGEIPDSLFGFRVYPIADLLAVMHESRWMRRYDFDAEAVVRLCWRGVPAVSLPAPVRYFRPEEGGVSHFNYWRDNVLLTWMHLRLFLGFLVRLPRLLARRKSPP